MEKLSKKTVDIILNIVEVGKLFNVEVFIIDKSGIRAKSSDESYIFLVQEANLDFLEFDSLCISRVSEFRNRLSFMEGVGDNNEYDIYVSSTKTLDSGNVIVHKLLLKSDMTSIEMTGDNAGKYKIPRNVVENNLVSFSIDEKGIEVLTNFPRAIQHKSKALNIKGINGVIVASTQDIEGDHATHVLTTEADFSDAKKDFSFIYNIGNLIPMLRKESNLDITLTERGILLTEINDIRVIIFPEKRA